MAEHTRLQQWWDEMSQRDSVKAIANPQEFYIERYAKYATGTTN